MNVLRHVLVAGCQVVAAAAACNYLTTHAAAADEVDYVRDVKPLLTKHCLACHSAVRQKSGYRIDTAAGVIRGGGGGAAVVPGRSAESPLLHAVLGSHDHPKMPPADEGRPLDAEEIETLRRWIDAGAKAPAETPPPDPRSHWAFQPVRRPPVPDDATSRSPNAIDAFVRAEQRRRGVAPAPAAPKHVLLRRVYLDLIGLPPTTEELHAFLRDDSADAYEKVVDRLLASPQYGERWGRHWMDVWRYSDWAGWGKQVRDSQPHIWHWRDWIVEQLNADRPYDEMLTAMLAADEQTPTDRSELRATGYLARNFKLLSREQWLQDTVEHTCKSLLGLTLNCARCHDHMSDPIEQREYYAFRAIFEPHQVRIDRLPGTPDIAADGLPRVFDKDLQAATYLFVRGDERTPRKDQPIAAGVPELLGGKFEVRGVTLPREAFDPARRAFVVEEDLAAAEQAARSAEKKRDDLRKAQAAAKKSSAAAAASQADRDLRAAEHEAEAARARHAALLCLTQVERREAAGDKTSAAWKKLAEATVAAQRRVAVVETKRERFQVEAEVAAAEQELQKARSAAGATSDKLKPAEAKLDAAEKKRAAVAEKLQDAESALAAAPSTSYTPRKADVYPAESSGRRSALARWITDKSNPLTARVAVNHVWGRHFDRALVATTANFGTLGAPPTHPQLLDWLAAEFVDPQTAATQSGPSPRPWSMKHLHRLIVTSNTYRQAARHDAAASGDDPDNFYLTRFPARRLEAEAVRDCILACAGELDRTFGGPDLDHQQGLTSNRRSLYFRHAAEKQMTFLKLFDTAAVTECYERRESVMPQQALALANSELTLVKSRKLAGRLHTAAPADDDFVTAVYETIISRPPNTAERAECRLFLERQTAWLAAHRAEWQAAAAKSSDGVKPAAVPELRAREMLTHALFNHHEFVTLP